MGSRAGSHANCCGAGEIGMHSHTHNAAPPKPDLVVVGMAYFEVFVPPHVRPSPGEEVFVDGMTLTLGGALNTASVAAALGLNVTLCLPMGEGLVDQAVKVLAQRLGITLMPLPAPDNPAISLVFSDAQDRAFVSTAALDTLRTVKRLPASTWVHVPGLEEAARLATPLAQARQQGAHISVSGSWSPHQLQRLATRHGRPWDLLVLNEKEAQAACGGAQNAPANLSAAADSVLVTRGSHGVTGTLNGTRVQAPSAPVTVRDATGAGDAFCAGVIAGLVRGMPPLAAVQLGTHAAALVLQQTGGLVTHAKSFANLTPNN